MSTCQRDKATDEPIRLAVRNDASSATDAKLAITKSSSGIKYKKFSEIRRSIFSASAASAMGSGVALPTGIIEFAVLPIAGWIASRYINVRCYVAIVTLCIPLGGFLGIRLTPLESQWSLVGSTWLLYVFAIGAAVCYSLLAANFAGHTKRAFVNGLWFVVWSCGSVAGANFFKTEEAPRYFTGVTALLGFTCGTMLAFLIFTFYCKWENRRRDRPYGAANVANGEADEEGVQAGFMDKTDIENKHFRYVY